MKNPNIIQPEDLRISQIIDANLDRAREGLRVLEDWARFGLGNEGFVIRIKNFRQILGKNHLEIYKLSRNHIEDQCKGLSHVEQINRNSSSKIEMIFSFISKSLVASLIVLISPLLLKPNLKLAPTEILFACN